MPDVSSVCVKAIRGPFFAAAAATRRPVPELAAEVGVDHALLADNTARIPHAVVVRVWDTFAARCDDPTFGLTAAAIVGTPRVDAVDYVLQRASTLRDLVAHFVRYQRLFHDANATSVDENGDTCAMHHNLEDCARSRHFTEFVLAMWVGRLRSLRIGDALHSVSLRHAPAPDRAAAYARAFGDTIQFEAAFDGVTVPRARMDVPLVEGDPEFVRSFEAQLQRELAELPSGTTFADEVRGAIAWLLRHGEPFEIEPCAKRLAVSSRTLQRRLETDGATFRDLVDDTRRAIALQKIAQPFASVADLAFLLGFSEARAFSRAFRRWTGQSPTEYLAARRDPPRDAPPVGG